MAAIAAHHGHADGCALPLVLVVHLSDGNLELGAGAINQPAESVSLLFQRARPDNPVLDACDADQHF